MIIKLYQLHELHWLAIHGEGPEYIFRQMDESGMGYSCVNDNMVDFADSFDTWRDDVGTKWPSFEKFCDRELNDEEYIRDLVSMAGPVADEVWDTYKQYQKDKQKKQKKQKKEEQVSRAKSNIVVFRARAAS